MSIKGHAYDKTSWSYQERPVTSEKLNAWDDRIEAALELVHFLLNQTWGGGNGVISGATDYDLQVVPLSPPALRVEVRPGYAYISRLPFKLAQATQTVPVTPPVALPRIDLVQARLVDWDIAVKTGVEAASPTAPAPDADCIALATLYLRPGMDAIKAANDGVNGYITDVRHLL